MINGESNVQCANRKCKAKHNQAEMVRVPDDEATKKWQVVTHKTVCPKCGHDEYFKDID